MLLPGRLSLLIVLVRHLGVGALVVGGGGEFDVTHFGAMGDGVHDDTASINLAYAACNSAGGGTVLFPPHVASQDGATTTAERVFNTGPFELACNNSVTMLSPTVVVRARTTTTGWPMGLDCPEPAQGRTAQQMAPLLSINFGQNITL
jgi:hypothetical protein